MKINQKQQEVRKNVNELSFAIQTAIDDICTKHDFNITYAEINAALIDVLKSNNGFELKEIWKNDE